MRPFAAARRERRRGASHRTGLQAMPAAAGGSFIFLCLFEPLPGPLLLALSPPCSFWGIKVAMDDELARAARAKKGCPFLSTEQAGFYLGLSARKMQSMRAAGTGPRFRRHSRYVRYHIDDLDSWSEASGERAGHD